MGATQPTAINYDEKLLASKARQSSVVGKEVTDILRCNATSDKMVEYPFETDSNKPAIRTLWQAFAHGCKINPNGNCLGFRPFGAGDTREPYTWLSYSDVQKKVLSASAKLSEMTIFTNKTQENIGIFGKNRAEWAMSMLAIWHQNHRVIPLYDTLGDEATKHILQQTGLKLLFAEVDELSKIWNALETQNNDENEAQLQLKSIVYFDEWMPYNNKHENITEEDKKNAEKFNINLIPFTSLTGQSTGTENVQVTVADNDNNDGDDAKESDCDPNSDLAIIMYTSGTTGLPKGVMLTHGNILSTAAAFMEKKYLSVKLDQNDRYVSYLPLAHIFEIAVECTMLCVGASIGYYQGDIRKITDDFAALQPTILCGVPRVFQKVYDKVQTQAAQSGAIKRYLIGRALTVGTYRVRNSQSTVGTIWDKLVFSKVKHGAGWEHVRVIVSGAAPLPGYLMEFLQVVTGADVRQGYGMTETVCAGGFTTQGDGNVGHVGPPTPNCEFKLRDVPEMNYFSTDKYPRGEIMIRGPSIFQGYYKLPDKTNETLVSSTDGSEYKWIATGDIGRINPNGTLTIIDRRKNIFKLAQGEYVAVEKIEASYLKIPCINQIWVYGNSFKTILVGVVVPDATWLAEIAKREKWGTNVAQIGSKAHRDWFKNMVQQHGSEIKNFIKQDMKKNGETGLKGFEKVKDIMLESEIGELLTGFTVEKDLLTPSMKLKRPMLLKHYVDELKQLYADNGQPANENEHWIKS